MTKSVVMDDVAALHDVDVQRLLRRIEPDACALIVKVAGKRVRDAVLRNVSQSARTAVEGRISELPTPSEEDIARAHRLCVDALNALVKAGDVSIPE